MLHTAVPAPAPAPAPAIGWTELVPHREFLVRFARRRLLDPALAEDLVHDVFEAVASGRASFGGRSALRSWLVAILKHKIVDLVRERCDLDSLDAGDADDGGADGSRQRPELTCPGPRPDECAEQRQRLRHTLARMAALPPGLRQAFELRVLHEQSTEQVCEALAISADNLFVRLHRARRQLLS